MISHRVSVPATVLTTCLTLVGALSGCTISEVIAPPSQSASVEDKKIVLADVDFDPDTLVPETQPVADYLAKHLKKIGITDGAVEIAPDVDTVAQWMASGEVNLYFDSVYPAMLVMEQSGAKPILRRWKDGVPEYNTLFITRRDSQISDLRDLQGNMIALQKPDSSSGFMFPMVTLLNAQLNPVEKAEANHAVASDQIGYVFSGRDETTVEWVLTDKVIAGAIDSETFSELSESDRNQLKVFAETDMFPRHVVLASPTLSGKQLEAIKTVLLEMEESKQGQAALAEFSETTQFDEFPEGAEAAISRLQGSYQMLQSHLAQTQE